MTTQNPRRIDPRPVLLGGALILGPLLGGCGQPRKMDEPPRPTGKTALEKEAPFKIEASRPGTMSGGKPSHVDGKVTSRGQPEALEARSILQRVLEDRQNDFDRTALGAYRAQAGSAGIDPGVVAHVAAQVCRELEDANPGSCKVWEDLGMRNSERHFDQDAAKTDYRRDQAISAAGREANQAALDDFERGLKNDPEMGPQIVSTRHTSPRGGLIIVSKTPIPNLVTFRDDSGGCWDVGNVPPEASDLQGAGKNTVQVIALTKSRSPCPDPVPAKNTVALPPAPPEPTVKPSPRTPPDTSRLMGTTQPSPAPTTVPDPGPTTMIDVNSPRTLGPGGFTGAFQRIQMLNQRIALEQVGTGLGQVNLGLSEDGQNIVWRQRAPGAIFDHERPFRGSDGGCWTLEQISIKQHSSTEATRTFRPIPAEGECE